MNNSGRGRQGEPENRDAEMAELAVPLTGFSVKKNKLGATVGAHQATATNKTSYTCRYTQLQRHMCPEE